MPGSGTRAQTYGNEVIHADCWAKTLPDGAPGISVRDHCLNVGCVAEALVNLLPKRLQELLPPEAATLAALHDVGKVVLPPRVGMVRSRRSFGSSIGWTT